MLLYHHCQGLNDRSSCNFLANKQREENKSQPAEKSETDILPAEDRGFFYLVSTLSTVVKASRFDSRTGNLEVKHYQLLLILLVQGTADEDTTVSQHLLVDRSGDFCGRISDPSRIDRAF